MQLEGWAAEQPPRWWLQRRLKKCVWRSDSWSCRGHYGSCNSLHQHNLTLDLTIARQPCVEVKIRKPVLIHTKSLHLNNFEAKMVNIREIVIFEQVLPLKEYEVGSWTWLTKLALRANAKVTYYKEVRFGFYYIKFGTHQENNRSGHQS